MADPLWLTKNNMTTIQFGGTNGSIKFDSLEALGSHAQAFIVILYSLTSLLAFSGNSLVILVELYGKRSAPNLRKFLINLAISDILIGVLSVPFIYTDFMLGRWIFHPLLCPIAQFVQLLSVFVTTYTLTAIAIERYFATLHPLSIGNTWFRSHCHLVLLVGWLFGSIFSSIIIKHTKAMPFDYKNETMYDCRHDVDWPEHEIKIYIGVSVIFTFALPMIFISISYGAIGKKLLNCPFIRNRSTGNNSFEKRNSEFINKIRVFKMLVAVVILFVICWLPMKTFMLLIAFWPSMIDIESVVGYYIYFGTYFLCHWLSMANSFVNPIIYCFMSKSFRADLIDLIMGFYERFSQHSTKTTEVKATG